MFLLGKGADLLVEEAVSLSLQFRVPKVVIGATILSLGTTLPEVSVSVLASIYGNPAIALGNAVGSIICDTGLILGLAAIISPPILDRKLLNRQGWIQVGSGVLLVVMCIPYSSLDSLRSRGGSLPQWAGFLFMGLLGLYLFKTFQWSRNKSPKEIEEEIEETLDSDEKTSTYEYFVKIPFALALIILSSQVLIPAFEELAIRFGISESVIGATLVAFGTSLPELVTAITAARKNHSELAVGNVIGADILNVLFVAGMSASVTKKGLIAPPEFFFLYFPIMLGVLMIFRLGIWLSPERIGRKFGVILVALYIVATYFSFLSK
jgi:cation:H+ antiporter